VWCCGTNFPTYLFWTLVLYDSQAAHGRTLEQDVFLPDRYRSEYSWPGTKKLAMRGAPHHPHPVKAGLLGLNISNYFKYIWWLCASSVVVLAVLKTE